MSQTLWEEIQAVPHQTIILYREIMGHPVAESEKHNEARCHRCQLERWAREKDKEYREDGMPGKVLRDLGVPEEP